MFGKPIRVSFSKHQFVQMPKDGTSVKTKSNNIIDSITARFVSSRLGYGSNERLHQLSSASIQEARFKELQQYLSSGNRSSSIEYSVRTSPTSRSLSWWRHYFVLFRTEISEEEIRNIFSQYGTIKRFKFFEKDRKMALIEMDSIEEAIAGLIVRSDRISRLSHVVVAFSV